MNEKENILAKSPSQNLKPIVCVEELQSLTSHVCFQIFHLPHLPLPRYLELAAPYIVPFVSILENNTAHPLVFLRKLFACIASRYNDWDFVNLLNDYYAGQNLSTIPTITSLGMREFLTTHANCAVQKIARNLSKEYSFEQIKESLSIPQILSFFPSVAELELLIKKEYTLYQLQFFPFKVAHLPPISDETWLSEAWEVVERSMDICLLNYSNSSKQVICQLPLIIETYSNLDKTCFLLEKILLKAKLYLNRQEDFPLAIFQYFLTMGVAAAGKIEFDDPLHLFDFFPHKVESNDLDPDLCTELIRKSTKSKNICNILANLFASQEAIVKSFQSTLLNEYIFKGKRMPRGELANLCKMIGPSANCLLVMMSDCMDDVLTISSTYWPPLPSLNSPDHPALKREEQDGVVLGWQFDLIILSITFPNNADSVQICCNQQQANFLSDLEHSQAIKFNPDIKNSVHFWLEQGVIDIIDGYVKLAPVHSPKIDAFLYKISSLPSPLGD